MELSLICPVAHLAYTSLLPGRFCIAPVALKYQNYRDYFATHTHSEYKYKVILDNGIFEDDKVSVDQYLTLIQQLHPTVVVIPDSINADAQHNWYDALNFVERLRTTLRDVKMPELMYVAQCQRDDDTGFWETLAQAHATPDIQWIGICRDAVYNAFGRWTLTEDQELNRFYFSCTLQRRYTPEWIMHMKWHFLGMGKRLDLLPHYWFVDSMDTASLFYQSILGNRVTDEYILPGELKRPKDYFAQRYTNEEHWISLLHNNCTRALLVAQQADANRRHILGGRL